MSSHRDGTRPPVPNWLKAWYAFLAFMIVVTVITQLGS